MTSSPELFESIDIKVAGLHEPLLFGGEAALEKPFEGGVPGGPHEEGIACHEVEGGDVEANGLHHVPVEFPEGQTHEACSLDHQEAQPAPELPPDMGFRLRVDLSLFLLHLLQLYDLGAARRGHRCRNHFLDCFCHLAIDTRGSHA